MKIDTKNLPTGLVCPACGSTDGWDSTARGDCEDLAGCNACDYEGTVYDFRLIDMIDDDLYGWEEEDLVTDDEGVPLPYLAAVVEALRAEG